MSTGPVETPRESGEAQQSAWHPVNIGHLVMGVAFLGLVVLWALVTADLVDLDRSHWLLPLPWLVAGSVGLVATVLRGRRADWPASGRMKGWLSQDSQH